MFRNDRDPSARSIQEEGKGEDKPEEENDLTVRNCQIQRPPRQLRHFVSLPSERQ